MKLNGTDKYYALDNLNWKDLPANTDIFELLTPGEYFSSTTRETTLSYKNLPPNYNGANFKLTVELISFTGGKPFIKQLLKTAGNRQFSVIHQLNNMTNSGWVEHPFPQVFEITLLNGWTKSGNNYTPYYSKNGRLVTVQMGAIYNLAEQAPWKNIICRLPNPISEFYTADQYGNKHAFLGFGGAEGTLTLGDTIPAKEAITLIFSYITKDG